MSPIRNTWLRQLLGKDDAMTNWTSDELTKIAGAEELRIASVRRDGTLRSPVTIWVVRQEDDLDRHRASQRADRKSIRLNSSHEWISYAVFCLKKKKKREQLYTN